MKKQKAKPIVKNRNLRELYVDDESILRFSPTAWAKLRYFQQRGPMEIGGFGVSDTDDLLYVRDFVTVKQHVSTTSVSFDDVAVADYCEDMVARGLVPEQFFRVWLHTHPAGIDEPSGTDEETFERVFGKCDWALMVVLASRGRCYARLRFNVGPGGDVLLPTEVDYSQPFEASDTEAWEAEYLANIIPVIHPARPICDPMWREDWAFEDTAWSDEIVEQFELMEPAERQAVMSELANRPDLWSEESEVCDQCCPKQFWPAEKRPS